MQLSFFMQESKGCTSAQGGIYAAVILRALKKPSICTIAIGRGVLLTSCYQKGF